MDWANDQLLLLTHAGATSFMAGLVWFVQVVHYPLAARVPPDAFVAYQREHVRRTGPVVGPAMLVEAITASMLLVARPNGVPDWSLFAGFALLAIVWASTAFLQVPAHNRLAAGFEAGAVRRLVTTNWIRTAAWSLRAFLALAMLAAHAGAAP